MSWAGRSILSMQKVDNVPDDLWDELTQKKENAVTALSKLSVRHGDFDVRNITYDDRTAQLMLIDFDRSSFVCLVFKQEESR